MASNELMNKKVFIFDMDGTIYLGEQPLPNAVDFINKLDKRYIFFSNNASRDSAYYLEKLHKMGFKVTKDQILTSANVLIKFLKTHRMGKKVFVLGTSHLQNMFEENGIELFDCDLYEKSDMLNLPDIVVTSFDTKLTYDRLERACTYIRNGAEWLTTHPDVNCPVEYGYIPDCGAINELIRVSTGKPLPKVFGKPHGEVVDMLEEITGEKRSNMVIFGDRLYTDIALGKKNNMMAVLLLTGEATLDDSLEVQEYLRPDKVFQDFFDVEEYYNS